MKNSTSSIILIFGIIFILVSLCGYLIWNNIQKQKTITSNVVVSPSRISQNKLSPNEFENMKKYTYSKFSLFLPKDWYVHNEKTSNQDNAYLVFVSSPELKSIPKGRAYEALRVHYKPNTNSLTFNEYKNYIESAEALNMQDIAVHNQYEVNGNTVFESRTKEGEERDSSWSPFPDYISSTIYKNGSSITIFMEKSVDKNSNEYETYRQIVSSIKFE
jgi:hypothetical protein